MTLETSQDGLIVIALKNDIANDSNGRWPKRDAELKRGRRWVDWLFAPDVPMIRQVIKRQGYALLIKCESVGYRRTVKIGTKIGGKIPVWTDLSNCKVTPKGLRTPQVDEYLRSKMKEPLAPPVKTDLRQDTASIEPKPQPEFKLTSESASVSVGFPLREDGISVTLERITWTSPNSGPTEWEADAIIGADGVRLPTSKVRLSVVDKTGSVKVGETYRLTGPAFVSAKAQQDGSVLWTLSAHGVVALPVEDVQQTEDTNKGQPAKSDDSIKKNSKVRDPAQVQARLLMRKILEDLAIAQQRNDADTWLRLFDEADAVMDRLAEVDKRWVERTLRNQEKIFRTPVNSSGVRGELDKVLIEAVAALESSDLARARELHGRAFELFQRIPIRETRVVLDRLNELQKSLNELQKAHGRSSGTASRASATKSVANINHLKEYDLREKKRRARRYVALIQTEMALRRVGAVSKLCREYESYLLNVPGAYFREEVRQLGEFKAWVRKNGSAPK